MWIKDNLSANDINKKKILFFSVGCIIVSFILNLFKLGDRFQVFFLLFWILWTLVALCGYLIADKSEYRYLIEGVHILKCIALVLLIVRFGFHFEGFAQADAAGFMYYGGILYRGEYIEDYLTRYPPVVSFLYKFFGENPSVVLLLNCVFTTVITITVEHMMRNFGIKKSIFATAAILYVALSPLMLVISLYFWREATEFLFLIMSLSVFFRYFKERKISLAIISIVITIPAIILHDGYIIFPAIYFLFYIGESVCKSRKSAVISVLVLAVMIVVLAVLVKNGRLAYFRRLKSGSILEVLQEIRESKIFNGGESIYIDTCKLNDLSDLPMYIVKMTLYLLFSPTPKFWRGIKDAFYFVTDSFPAILCILMGMGSEYMLIRNNSLNSYFGDNGLTVQRKQEYRCRILFVSAMLLIILCTSVAFGLGTATAGTAIRHRCVFIPMYALMAVVFIDTLKKRKENGDSTKTH